MKTRMQSLVILPAVFIFINLLATSHQGFKGCLPAGIDATDVVSAELIKSKMTVKKTTVEQKLNELGARCKNDKLVDSKGAEIVFYRLRGCWGNPPADYQEILQRQNEELEKLRKRYVVIEMTCNPEGVSIS